MLTMIKVWEGCLIENIKQRHKLFIEIDLMKDNDYPNVDNDFEYSSTAQINNFL